MIRGKLLLHYENKFRDMNNLKTGKTEREVYYSYINTIKNELLCKNLNLLINDYDLI